MVVPLDTSSVCICDGCHPHWYPVCVVAFYLNRPHRGFGGFLHDSKDDFTRVVDLAMLVACFLGMDPLKYITG